MADNVERLKIDIFYALPEHLRVQSLTKDTQNALVLDAAEEEGTLDTVRGKHNVYGSLASSKFEYASV